MSIYQRGASSVDKMTSSHPSRVTKSIASIFKPPDIYQLPHMDDLAPFILIEGAPGIGKTVLVNEIAYRWACGEILQGKKLFILFIRNPYLHDIDSINQKLISYFSCDYLSDTEVEVAVNKLRKSRGQNIVFLIDGFDECPGDCQLKLFIQRLAKHEILPNCMVVITSRPHATISLRPSADQRIEILGFAKKERDEYIAESLNEFPEKKTSLKKYLKLQPIINSVMHVPLHLAVLLYLFKKDVMPETLTELNEQFIIHTIYRHLEKKEMQPPSNFDVKISHLPHLILKIVIQLSQLALFGLLGNDRQEKKLVFTYDEVKAVCPNIDKFPNGFGVLQAVQHHAVKGPGITISFNFLHLTMQEFLAAYYVSKLPSEEQLSMAFCENLSNYVWLMYVGIVGTESDAFIAYQSKISNDPLPTNMLLLFQFYLEAKKFTQVPRNISSLFADGNIEVFDTRMDPYSVVSLVNFIAKSDVHLRSLSLSSCSITDEGMSILQGFFTDYKEKLNSVKHVSVIQDYITSLWGTDSSDTTAENSNTGLLLVPYLRLFSNDLKDSGTFELFASLHHNTSLLQLDVSHNGITSSGAVAISDCVKNNSTLQVLNISQNELSDDGIITISHSLKTCNSSLLQLDISHNGITSSGAVGISECLKDNSTLQVLNLSQNKLSGDGVIAISDSLKINSALQVLNISQNELLDDGVIVISESLTTNCTLNTLNIAHNKITNKGASKISEVIKCNTSLSDLNISNNFIDKEGIMEILIASTKSLSFQRLNCIFNTLSQSDFVALSNYNKKENAVQIFNTSWNRVSFEGELGCKELLIKTTICYEDGHDIQECDHDMNSQFYRDSPFYNELLYCCIKDRHVEELFLEGKFGRERLADMQLLNICVKSIYVNKTLIKLHIGNFIIGDEEVLVIDECLKFNIVKELDISRNFFNSGALKKIIETVNCTALRKLDISKNDVSDSDVKFISVCLKHNISLQELIMAGYYKIADNGALMFAEAIKVNTTLLVLDISYHKISDVGVKAIGDSLRYNRRLQELNISYNDNVTIDGALYLLGCIRSNTTLMKLAMNYYDWTHLIDVVDCLKSNNTLQSIDGVCDWSDLVIAMSEDYKEWIMSATDLSHFFLQKATINLKRKHICNFKEKHINAIEMANYLLSKAVLRELELIHCDLTNREIMNESELKLHECAAYCNKKQKLEILQDSHDQHWYQPIVTAAIINMIESIKASTTLKILLVNRCQIQDEGAAIISDCIIHNTSIRELELSCNFITSIGMNKIFKAVKVNKVIRKLDVSSNKISDDVAPSISECLTSNATLQHLNVRYNDMHHKGIAVIVDSLKDNTTLLEFFVHYIYFKDNSHEIAVKLATVLKTNQSLHTISIEAGTGINFMSVKLFDVVPFNKVIFSAMYSNKSVTKLILPGGTSKGRYKELCVLQNEVENLNLRRRNEGIPIVQVDFPRSYYSDYTAYV